MARWIAETPQAKAEPESADGLLHLARHSTAAPSAVHSLHPHQRAAVLNGPQRVRASSSRQPSRNQHGATPCNHASAAQRVAGLPPPAVLAVCGLSARASHFSKLPSHDGCGSCHAPSPVRPWFLPYVQPAPITTTVQSRGSRQSTACVGASHHRCPCPSQARACHGGVVESRLLRRRPSPR